MVKGRIEIGINFIMLEFDVLVEELWKEDRLGNINEKMMVSFIK